MSAIPTKFHVVLYGGSKRSIEVTSDTYPLIGESHGGRLPSGADHALGVRCAPDNPGRLLLVYGLYFEGDEVLRAKATSCRKNVRLRC
jgi:hypothetical protein